VSPNNECQSFRFCFLPCDVSLSHLPNGASAKLRHLRVSPGSQDKIDKMNYEDKTPKWEYLKIGYLEIDARPVWYQFLHSVCSFSLNFSTVLNRIACLDAKQADSTTPFHIMRQDLQPPSICSLTLVVFRSCCLRGTDHPLWRPGLIETSLSYAVVRLLRRLLCTF
jgi:hypothetical protein